MGFEFLDRHYGAVLELLHTASVTDRPSIQGTVKGLQAGVSYYGDLNRTAQSSPQQKRSDSTNDLPTSFAALFFIGALILFVIGGTQKPGQHGQHTTAPWVFYVIGGVLAGLCFMAMSVVWSRRLPRALARARRADASSDSAQATSE